MTEITHSLKTEYLKRVSKNPRYSLRAFATSLGVNHATLSGFLSGRRKISDKSAQRIGLALGWAPEQLAKSSSDTSAHSYQSLPKDHFDALADWTFDAVLEFTRLPGVRIEPAVIAQAFGLSELQSRLTLDSLERLSLLVRDSRKKLKLNASTTTTILNADETCSARRRLQKSLLEKSVESVDRIDPSLRDHTSMTFAVARKDLPEAKKRIAEFRRSLDRFLQRPGVRFDTVYQLQVSLFPLTQKDPHDT